MINKRSLWFLTLFSLILVLSVYYITMPSELLLTANNKEEDKSQTVSASAETSDNESAELVALRVESEEQMLDEINELKAVLTNAKSTSEEKNSAFEKMQNINHNRGQEETLEKLIEKDHKLKSFVKITDSDIQVVVDSKKGNVSLANKIMRTVQGEYDTKVNVSVKFQK